LSERPTGDRKEGRGRRGERDDREPRVEVKSDLPETVARSPEGERPARGEGRRPRPERGEPREPRRIEETPSEATQATVPAAQGFSDSLPPAADGQETAGERAERSRRRRRRGGRDRDESAEAGSNGEALATESTGDVAEGLLAPAAADSDGANLSADASTGMSGEAVGEERGERDGTRRRRGGRDRNRREPRPEGDTPPSDMPSAEAAFDNNAPYAEVRAEAAADAPAAWVSELVSERAPVAVEPVAEPVPQASVVDAPTSVVNEPLKAKPEAAAPIATLVAPAPVEAVPAAPVESFVLPTETLQSVAQAAGLEWVNSDVEKIRAVQDAMAEEPAPVRKPRLRKPVSVVDDGPLVLVETSKDLSQVKLPFENGDVAQH
jgi:ribonuclease E